MQRVDFEVKPLAPFRLDLTVWTLRRRPQNTLDRWDGHAYCRALPLSTGIVDVAVRQTTAADRPKLTISVTGRNVDESVLTEVRMTLDRLLGLNIDLSGFYEFARKHPALAELADRFRGMKPPRFPSVFEGVVNIVCQQITLTLGIRILCSLSAAFGPAFEHGGESVHAFPRSSDLATLDSSDLRQLGLSHSKGRAIIELAQAISAGEVNLESLAICPDDEAMRQLIALRGVGRWTAEYVLLRGLGRTHIFPGDDVGARKNLQQWLQLNETLDYEGVRRVLSDWQQYGGLIYFHLLLDRLAAAGEIVKPKNL